MEAIKIKEWLTVEFGDGSGSGDGYGDGDGSGSGDGYGDGDGYGSGDGYGDGYGSGDGSGSGDGYGDGYGDGDGYGSGDGYGDGYGSGDGYGDGIKEFEGKPVFLIDEIQTIITHLHSTYAKGFVLNGDFTLTPCFVVKARKCFAHGETLREAQAALEEKLFDDMDVDEKISLFIEQFPDKDKDYPAKEFYSWHNKLTGSCEMGRKAFAKDHGIDIENDTMTVIEFIDLTRTSFGGSVIQQLEETLKARK